MSKQIECERKLERVSAERDYWRALSQQQAIELAATRRQFERAQMWHAVLAGGALPAIDGQIEWLQRQRDDALLERDELLQLIVRMRNHAQQDFQETGYHFDEYRAMIDEARLENGQPHLVEALVMLHDGLEEATANAFNEHMISVQDRLTKPLTLIQEAGLMLFEASQISALAARRYLGKTLIALAFGHSAVPPLICDQICRSLSITGEVNQVHLEKLGLDWIKENLPEAPTHFATLQIGLEWNYKERKSKQSRQAFADLNGLAPRTLDRYHGWYKAIQAQARFLPPEVGELVEQKIRQRAERRRDGAILADSPPATTV
jgi:hypothetical protein